MQCLLGDIAASRVDNVAVYKVDRPSECGRKGPIFQGLCMRSKTAEYGHLAVAVQAVWFEPCSALYLRRFGKFPAEQGIYREILENLPLN